VKFNSFKPLIKILSLQFRNLLIELRRVVSLLAIPWVGAVLLCVIASWYLISVVGLDALLAPVLKTWAFLKPLLLQAVKIVVAFFIWLWLHTFGKISAWLTEIIAIVFGYFGGFKAWSVKKLLRHCVRFVMSFSARFFLVSVLINLLFGRERKGAKQVPHLLSRVHRTRGCGVCCTGFVNFIV